MNRPNLAAWLTSNPGVIEVGIRIQRPEALPADVREAIADFKPLVVAMLANDLINADGDDWSSFRKEVESLEAGGITRGDALRHAYARRFKRDPGPIEPSALTWLWEGA